MKVKEIMTTKMVTVDKDDSLKLVLDLMKKHDITKIPVTEEKKFFGLVTDNVIAYKLGSIRKRGITASRLHASSVTEKEVLMISPEEEVKNILNSVGEPGPTMLPVVEKEKLVGIITKANLLPLVTSKNQLHSIMQKKVLTVGLEERVIHARRIMITNNVARLPVLEEKKLVGIISDIEIALAFASLKKSFSLGKQKHHLDELLVKDVMRSPVVWSNPSMIISDAAQLMLKQNVGALPLLENDKLVGMVTRTDLLKTIVM
ncbi:MAG TPA: CBS domain-containing protein [Candidatus Thermoplasmatota archaeon]|nr:CBS domain-containing protein [Candidatus Thermoplasmatota archaeon]